MRAVRGLSRFLQLQHFGDRGQRKTMEEVIDRRLINSAIRHHASLGFTYANNPKAGCGHIKAAMWVQVDRNTGIRTFSNQPHHRAGSPFVRYVFKKDTYDFEQFVRTPFFSVVRNPFSRILSAYLSKISPPRRGKAGHIVWQKFCVRYGVEPSDTKHTVSFKTFLRSIASDDIQELDPHFRPQYINLLYPFVNYGYVGKLERMDEVHEFMADNGVEALNYNAWPTGASKLATNYYDAECEAIVREIYRDDFIQFGYDTDIRNIADVAPVPHRDPVPDRLMDFIRSEGPSANSGRFAARNAGVLRKFKQLTGAG